MAVPITHLARNEPGFPQQFRLAEWAVDIVSDASWWKLCAVVKDNGTGQVLAWTVLPLPFGKSAFQNVREYLGLLLGLVLLHLLLREKGEPRRQQAVRWIGDNLTALRWAETSKVNSKSGQMANVAMVWAQLYGNFEIQETEYLEGRRMGDVDGATRDKVLTVLPPDLFRDVESIPGVVELFSQCDPDVKEAAVNHHKAFCLVHEYLVAIFK